MLRVRAAGRGQGSQGTGRELPGSRVEHGCSQSPPSSLLLKKAQEALENESKALHLPTCVERENYLPASGLDHWVGAGILEVLSSWEMGWPGAPWL